MARSSRWIALFLGAALPSLAHADFNFNQINITDYDSLVKEFSADSIYSSVTPASSLGTLGGFELGVVGVTMKAPDTQALVQKNSATTDFGGKLYNAGPLLRLGLPFGFTAEGMYLPKVKISKVFLNRWALAAMWTPTDTLLEDLPVNLAAKAYYTKTSLAYSQDINNSTTLNQPVPANITLDDKLWGIEALASIKLFVFEPYAGLGYVKAKGTLTVDAAGNASIFTDPAILAFAAANGISTGGVVKSLDSSPSSAVIKLGSDIRLAFFSLGAEYDRAFGKDVYMGRVSFRF